MCTVIHSFSLYLSRTYYVSGTKLMVERQCWKRQIDSRVCRQKKRNSPRWEGWYVELFRCFYCQSVSQENWRFTEGPGFYFLLYHNPLSVRLFGLFRLLTSKVLINQFPHLQVNHCQIDSSTWVLRTLRYCHFWESTFKSEYCQYWLNFVEK